jgi:hypothetical protein
VIQRFPNVQHFHPYGGRPLPNVAGAPTAAGTPAADRWPQKRSRFAFGRGLEKSLERDVGLGELRICQSGARRDGIEVFRAGAAMAEHRPLQRGGAGPADHRETTVPASWIESVTQRSRSHPRRLDPARASDVASRPARRGGGSCALASDNPSRARRMSGF